MEQESILADLEEIKMKFKAIIIFIILLFLVSCQNKHNPEKVKQVYNAIKNDIIIFKDYNVQKRGKAFIVFFNNEGSALTFYNNTDSSGFEFILRDRKYFIEKSKSFYKNYNFNDEQSFMTHMNKMIKIYNQLKVYAVFAEKRDSVGTAIVIAINPYDLLIFYPEENIIQKDFYEWALNRGELSKINKNWFYLKKTQPLNMN
ncbi:MAG: hypothetical protein JW956_08130 [Calditrichaceae bacterium]|nr:hypothetical protein [Calditrichaceae bacterium]